MPAVSIVMTAYQRACLLTHTLWALRKQTFKDFEVVVVEDGDDGGDTREVCLQHTGPLLIRYFQRVRRPNVLYSNPSVPNNIGLRNATGDIVVLQNAECMFMNDDGLETLVGLVKDTNAVFPTVWAAEEKNPNAIEVFYIHPTQRPVPWFFCGATKLKHFHDLRGFDEDYKQYGYDDNDMADRLKAHGITFEWTEDVVLKHQWHPRPAMVAAGEPETGKIYDQKKQAMLEGRIGVVRNLDREWGVE